jgi:hypothetical protein
VSSDLIRWGGLAGVLAGLMYVLTDILSLLAPQQRVFDSFSDYLQEVIFAVAVAGTLGAIAGLHALHSGRYGRLGAAGSLLAFIGYALFFVRTAVTILVGGQAPLYAVRISIVGALAVLIGSVLLGAMTLGARVLPWWCGVLLIVGFPPLGGLQRSPGDCAGDSVGVDRVRALVAKGNGRGATLTRELNFAEFLF